MPGEGKIGPEEQFLPQKSCEALVAHGGGGFSIPGKYLRDVEVVLRDRTGTGPGNGWTC